MAQPPRPDIREKLFRISTKPRALHARAGVILPETPAPIPVERLFSRPQSRRILELGAGWGEFCARWCQQHPTDEYLAFELKGDRVRRLLRKLERAGIERVKILPINFNWFLEEILPRAAFDLIIINFPDPWPKKKHWKHRLIDADFPGRMLPLLRPGGRIHAATDYGPYARRILRAFRDSPHFRSVFQDPDYRRQAPADFPATRFEEIHRARGLRSYYQCWEAQD